MSKYSEADIKRRFLEQCERRDRRNYSDGRLGPDDDGDVALSIGPHPDRELVVIDFGKPIEWTALDPQTAIDVAQALIKHAKAISTKPLTLTIPRSSPGTP